MDRRLVVAPPARLKSIAPGATAPADYPAVGLPSYLPETSTSASTICASSGESGYIPAAFGIKPDVHRSIVHDFNFVEVKIDVTAEVFFDDPFKVFFIDFNLAFYKAFILVIFHRINITHFDSPSCLPPPARSLKFSEPVR
jgi:hypothetical protein